MITRTVVFAVLAIVVLYGLFEARPLLVGPTLSVTSPTDGEAVPGGVVQVAGTSFRATVLTLDGAPLLANADTGQFSATLAFPPGTSILTFVARDRFGRSRTTTRTIFVPTN